CRSRNVAGHVLDIGGGHLLCSRYPEVYDFIFDHLPAAAFNHFERRAKIALKNKVINYPIEYNLSQLPIDEQIKYLISCVRASATDGIRPPPRNFEEWVRRRHGEDIADTYMIPYNRKIWGIEPNELDTDWLEKIPRYDVERVVRACIARQQVDK